MLRAADALASLLPGTDTSDLANVDAVSIVGGVAFRRNVLSLLADASLHPQPPNTVVLAIRQEPELCHPNWTVEEMLRIRPDAHAWSDTLLPAGVWAAPPVRPAPPPPPTPNTTASIPAASPVAGQPRSQPANYGPTAMLSRASNNPQPLPSAQPTVGLPSLCPFGLQAADVAAIQQHRSM